MADPVVLPGGDGSVLVRLPPSTTQALERLLQRVWLQGRTDGLVPQELLVLYDALVGRSSGTSSAYDAPLDPSPPAARPAVEGLSLVSVAEAAALFGVKEREVRALRVRRGWQSPRRGWLLAADVELEVATRARVTRG